MLASTALLSKLLAPAVISSDLRPVLQSQMRQTILDLSMPMAKLMGTDLVFGQMDDGVWASGNMESCLGGQVCFSKMEASSLENGSMEFAMVLACSCHLMVSFNLASGDKVSV